MDSAAPSYSKILFDRCIDRQEGENTVSGGAHIGQDLIRSFEEARSGISRVCQKRDPEALPGPPLHRHHSSLPLYVEPCRTLLCLWRIQAQVQMRRRGVQELCQLFDLSHPKLPFRFSRLP